MTQDFNQLATVGVQGLQPYQTSKTPEEVAHTYGIKNIIRLASNENPLGISPIVQEALQVEIKNSYRYPDSHGIKLKFALANKYDVDTNMITLGNGSNDILELIAHAFVSPAQSVIYSQHAFAVYYIITQAIGAKAIKTPARHWGHDLEAMQAAIQVDTRLIFIANPNNPTGTWLDKTQLKNFLDAVPKTTLVVVDEAYFEYCDDPRYPNSLQWLTDYPQLIVCRTFSKAYGLAGLRVGYAISHPEIANILNRLRQPFNINSLALTAATVALEDQTHLEKSLAIAKAGYEQLTNAFQAMNLDFIPSIGNFITVDVGDGVQVYQQLLRFGIITRPIDGIYEMPKHLRISIGLPEENEALIQALKKIFSFTD
jgi:histidinol-phosphate aminotransferase